LVFNRLLPEQTSGDSSGEQVPPPPSLRWRWHGVELDKPDWASWSHSLAWSLDDPRKGPLLWCAMNAYHKSMHFDLPATPAGWLRVIDTAVPPGDDLPSRPERWLPSGVPLESRSLILMVTPPLLAGQAL